ncbi:MAG: SIS domain-containing protein [Rickettsiales bacterium]|nr:SIS domain-containing protein [Rickettsiales bacterium]
MSEDEWLSLRAKTHATALQDFIANHTSPFTQLAERLTQCFLDGGKLLVCGNGGSACDAMHIAGEFVGRFIRERQALPAIALSADSGMLTAIGNDYGFEQIFARQIEAYGQANDVLIALSTSGQSPNVLKALAVAKQHQLHTVLLTGRRGEAMTGVANDLFVVPSNDTACIQEAHMFLLHALAERVEAAIAERTL